MRYLVTGGAGFIGSNIVEELIKRGEKVRVIDNFSTGKRENLDPFLDKIELIEGDIRDDEALEKALKGVDFVIHEAALRAVQRSVDDPLSTNDVNISGTLKLLLKAKEHKVKRVVFASSSSVYGDSEILPKKEDQLPSPVSPYATSKIAGEYYMRVFYKTFGLETVSLRYFNVFGPRQSPFSKYAAVIPLFINWTKRKEPLIIHGDGKQSRDFTYIDNVVDATIKACIVEEAKGEVFNVACGKNYTVLEVAEEIANVLGIKVKYKFTNPRPGDVRHTLADISKARKILGYEVKVDFKEGIRRTVEWFCKIVES
ncbi:MAG: LPS biosynthesis protein WbpP [Caldiserica bacterium]|nr:MAG: LPS biosynthesis protein WbpP [Caldisericota bacterium]